MSFSVCDIRIHHLNLGSLYPRVPRVHAICYGLLVETDQGLALVDTGFGTKDTSEPSRRMRLFGPWMGVPGRFEETAIHQVGEMGFETGAVHHIILTHLHFDHAGGLRDFPDAEVHVHRDELEAANKPRGFTGFGYDRAQWAHNLNWVLHNRVDGDWFGFESIQVIRGLRPEILLISLPGHTRGHCGVAIGKSHGRLLTD